MRVDDEVNEILGTGKNNNFSTNYNTKRQNNWQEQQRKDRQDIYDTMDRMAMIVGNDGNKFKEYLDVQSRFSKYSVGNSLVILEKAPNSTHIKDKNAWLEKGIELNNSAKGIKILEPVKNKGAIYYNPKVVYDISQTNAPKQDNVINYGDRVLLKALLHNCDVPREAVEKLPSGEIGAEYDKENNKLYVCKGMDRETLFQSLSQEMGNIELKDEEKSNMNYFISYCTSYMICKRYGIDVSNYVFKELPNEITNQKDGKGIRMELDKIRDNFEKVNTRMLDYFDMSSREKNKTVPER
jgi:hypothetical protein